jgi:hypothetical protein
MNCESWHRSVSLGRGWTRTGRVPGDLDYDLEPSPAEIAAIELEYPAIEAGVALVDAEIAVLDSPDELHWRCLMRALDRVASIHSQVPAPAATRLVA